MSEWTHDTLAADLASHFRGDHRKMVWENMQMGPVGSARPDVFVMFKSYTKPQPIAYEVKISRSDFLSDVTSGKWMAYKNFACAVFICVPKDLVKKTEVPDGVGLMVRSDKVWRATKRAILNDVLPDFWAMQKLLIDGVDRLSQRHRHQAGARYLMDKEINKRFGADVSMAVRDLNMARYEISRIEGKKKEVESEIDEIKDLAKQAAVRELSRDRQAIDNTLNAMRSLLSMPEDADRWRVLEAMRKLMDSVDGPRLRNLHTRMLERVRANLDTGVRNLDSALSDLNDPSWDELGEDDEQATT